MAWETRERGGRYYTRSRRQGSQVIREYFGSGPVAQIAAQLDALRQLRREEARATRQAEEKLLQDMDESVEELDATCKELTQAALEAAGYHQHHRGEWRKRRARQD